MNAALWSVQFSYKAVNGSWRPNITMDVLAPSLQRAIAVVEGLAEKYADMQIHSIQKRSRGIQVMFDPELGIEDATS